MPTASLLTEAEVMNAVSDALPALGFTNFSIALNHRVIFRNLIQRAGIMPTLGGSALIALDKLDKIGADGVCEELAHRGGGISSARRLLSMTEPDTNNFTLALLLCIWLSRADAQSTLARGLGYYTGPISEVVSDDFSESLGGEGIRRPRGMFSDKQVPAVGFSVGLKRILVLMEKRAIFPATGLAARVMACILPDTPQGSVLKIVSSLRAAGIAVDVYPEHRLSTLERAIKNVLDPDIPQGVRLVLVVVDISKEASAYDLVRHIDEASDMVIYSCHHPRRGIPLARNIMLDFVF